MSSRKTVSFIVLALAGLAGSLVALTFVAMPVRGQNTPEPSSCTPGVDKNANPSSLILGQGTAQVTLAMTHTCSPERLPVDMMFVVDVSNSMMRDTGGADLRTPISPGIPTPGKTPPSGSPEPPEPKTPAPPGGPNPGDRYDVCTARPQPPGGGGPGPIPTVGDPVPGPGPSKEPPPGSPEPTKPVKPTPTGIGPSDPLPEPFGDEDLIREVKSSINDFLSQDPVEADLVSTRLRTGLVSFADTGRRIQRLTDNPNGVRSSLSRLRGGGISELDQGLRLAEQELNSSANGRNGDEDRVKMMLVYSDGQFCPNDIRRGGSRRDQIEVIAIGVGRNYNRANMQQLASEREYVLELREIKELTRLYTTIVPSSRPTTMDTLTIVEMLSPAVAYVPNSANPAPDEVLTGTLKWNFLPATTPLTITYSVEPLTGGFIPVSDSSVADWVDSAQGVGHADFPDTFLDVLVPTATVTPTPTATSTATATSTPEPEPRYLPFLANKWPPATPTPGCQPELQTIDIALVVDTSTSMSDPTQAGGVAKLEAAIDAGKGLIDLLKFPADGSKDQAAVISFNHEAATVIGLSNDPVAIGLALDELRNRQAVGTRIDLGLQMGLTELQSARHRAANKRAVILVSDGVQTNGGTDAQVLAASQAIKDQGITLWTVALGNDAAVNLLQQAATSPAHFKFAPNAEGLRLIYEEIARFIPCGEHRP